MVETSPISFLVNILRLPSKGLPVRIDPDADQRAALAALHGLLEVKSLSAELLVQNWKRDGVRITGYLAADIVQACAVTLDPLDASIHEEISALFVPEGSKLARPDVLENGEMVLDADGEDCPEPFVGDTIDVGQLVEEFFVLGIDPYPRKPGAQHLAPASDDDDEERGPLYDQLRALKRER